MSDDDWGHPSDRRQSIKPMERVAQLRAERDSWQVRAEEAEEVVGSLRADRDRLAAENKKLRNEDTRDYELMEAAYQKAATDLAEAVAIVRSFLYDPPPDQLVERARVFLDRHAATSPPTE